MKQRRETTLEERIQIVRECIAYWKNYGEMALKLCGISALFQRNARPPPVY